LKQEHENRGAYANGSKLRGFQISQISTPQLDQTSTPMETDTPMSSQVRPTTDFEDPEPTANVNAGAYVDDVGLGEFSVNQTSSLGLSTPMETDVPPHDASSPSLGGHIESNQSTTPVGYPSNASSQALGVSPNPSPLPGPGDMPPPWVIRIGQEFLAAFQAQQAQDRVCLISKYLSFSHSFVFIGRVEQHADWIKRGH
jgi:hypothetical protein